MSTNFFKVFERPEFPEIAGPKNHPDLSRLTLTRSDFREIIQIGPELFRIVQNLSRFVHNDPESDNYPDLFGFVQNYSGTQ